MSGLLIVNADDWGGSEETTKAILGTFEAGRVTSASALVYMADSDRAAGLAREKGLPVGLHLNLTQPFDDEAVPSKVRERQRRVAERFAGAGRDRHPGTVTWRRWVYDPTVKAEVDRAIADQLERFEALYGGPPTHFDGHNYVDVCPNVFLSPAIPRGSSMRGSLGAYPLARSAMGRLRGARQAIRGGRFRCPDHVLHIADLQLDSQGEPRLRLARDASVEVISHPDEGGELAALMSSAWKRALGEYRLGSFADL